MDEYKPKPKVKIGKSIRELLIYLAVMLVIHVPLTFYRALFVRIIWNWFVPYISESIPLLSTVQVVAVLIIISTLKGFDVNSNKANDSKDRGARTAESVLGTLIVYPLSLLFAYVVKLFL